MAKQKYKKRTYKQRHIIVEKAEPWDKTGIEARFTNQEKTFIRDIQITRYMRKKDAIKFYMNYLHKSKRRRKEIRSEIIDKIHDIYPKHERIKLKLIRKTKTLSQPERKVYPRFSKYYETFEEWYLYGNTDLSSMYFKKIYNKHLKNPELTLKQLRGE